MKQKTLSEFKRVYTLLKGKYPEFTSINVFFRTAQGGYSEETLGKCLSLLVDKDDYDSKDRQEIIKYALRLSENGSK